MGFAVRHQVCRRLRDLEEKELGTGCPGTSHPGDSTVPLGDIPVPSLLPLLWACSALEEFPEGFWRASVPPAAPHPAPQHPARCPGGVTFILSMLASIFSCSTSLRACAMLAVLLLAIGTPGARGARHGAARHPETPKTIRWGLEGPQNIWEMQIGV